MQNLTPNEEFFSFPCNREVGNISYVSNTLVQLLLVEHKILSIGSVDLRTKNIKLEEER